MTREEEIIQAAKQKEKESEFTQIVKSAKGVNSSYGIGFLEGAEWADEHPRVKEIEVDEELQDFLKKKKAWVSDDWEVEYYNGDSFNHLYDLESLAKHFFELGLKAKKGE